ncbi:hypothetical protein G3O00_01715 [Burkholderia sp. Ac-20384]|nr:hypothetical protein [Burkholderia sp. Ac-20384]MBN3822335.1 hypothetical protein [Burkholderia sp. Ac-20384]
MRTAAWLMCWPLLGLMWVTATVGDSMEDACLALDETIGRLLDYAESE